ncbi:MAG: hypothetical protein FWF96_03475 [Kiritimatiellaeota bacterium]|nr:hypothetical protein [Kiritimatiellota bacterium]
MKKLLSNALLFAGAALAAQTGQTAENPVLFTAGQMVRVSMPEDGALLFSVQPMCWGPKWGWTGLRGNFQAREGGGSVANIEAPLADTAGINVNATITLTREGKRKIIFSGEFGASADTDIIYAALMTTAGPRFTGPGRLTLTDADGKETVDSMPPRNGAPAELEKAVKLVVRDADGEAVTITCGRPCDIPCHGQFRLPMARHHIKAGEPNAFTFTMEFPFDVDAYFSADEIPDPADIGEWFAWDAKSDTGPSVIDASGLLDAPAGKHGRIRAEGGKLVNDKGRVKFWGINTNYGPGNAPPREVAEQRAAWYAKYGVNAVRLHKFANGHGWAGICAADSGVAFDEAAAERMDYFVARLKEKGIYVTLSANFGLMISASDRANLPDYAVGNPDNRGWVRIHNPAIWLVPEAGDMQIAQLVNFLVRENPHTGMSYAKDPCVLAVELINENCPFFYDIWSGTMRNPGLKKVAGEKFAAWLRAKYKTEEAMLAAWGPRGGYNSIPDQGTEDESWDGLIYPGGNPWFWDRVDEDADGSQAFRRGRLIDAALFWETLLHEYFDRFVEAVRKTGYDGEIYGSNWMAGAHFSHYLNLLGDRRVGMIDRHNYFNGPASMLNEPGSGIVSIGLNTQMDDRPFMVSEWTHTARPMFGDPSRPSSFDLAGEGPAIFAAYGMGLNGWDVSFMFENYNDGVFKNFIRDEWDITMPNIWGAYPAVSRMVIRGDVRESGLLFARNIDEASLRQGKINFKDRLDQAHDVKAYSSDAMPPRLMAVGRMVVTLNDEPTPTEPVNADQFVKDGKLISSTGELAWRPGEKPRDGHITINTPNTQAVCGFTLGETAVLRDVDITTENVFATVYVSSLDNEKPVATTKNLLITAIARVRNTGHRHIATSTVDWGRGPVLMEPVKAGIVVKRPGEFTVHVLDQDGRRTGEKLAAKGRVVTFDTAVDKTIYYEVEFN